MEPRYNLGTESLSAGVTYRMDDENRVRAIFDMGSNEVGQAGAANLAQVPRLADATLCSRCGLPKGSHGLRDAGQPHASPFAHRLVVCVLLPAPCSLQGTLTWYNTGSLGGGGETRVSARMRMDKDSMQQVGLCFPGCFRPSC